MYLRKKNRPDTTRLRLIGIDAAVGRDELEYLALHSDIVDVPAGEVLCLPGQHPRQFVAVLDGYVDISDPSGAASISGPGTQFGGTEVLRGQPYDETVVARSDCRVLVIFGPVLAAAAHTSRRAAGESPGPLERWLGDRADVRRPTPHAALAS
jgi:CRP-like cAMP-binding protein